MHTAVDIWQITLRHTYWFLSHFLFQQPQLWPNLAKNQHMCSVSLCQSFPNVSWWWLNCFPVILLMQKQQNKKYSQLKTKMHWLWKRHCDNNNKYPQLLREAFCLSASTWSAVFYYQLLRLHSALLFSSRVLCPSLVTLCLHKSGRCAVELYHAPHLWYPSFYTSPMASSALQHWTASPTKEGCHWQTGGENPWQLANPAWYT